MFRSIRWLFVMSLLLSPALLASGSGSRTMDYAWLLFLRVNEPPQPIDEIEVVRAAGDSITDGVGDYYGDADTSCQYNSSNKYIDNSCDGYPVHLKSLLNNTGQYVDGLVIVENGFGGRTSTELIDGSDGHPTIRQIAQDITPDADQIVVLIGTNDSCGTSAPDGDEFVSNLKEIIQEIKDAGAEPVLVKIPYARKDGSGSTTCYSNSKIRGYNLRIDNLVDPGHEDYDASIKVTPPDLYTWFENHQDEIWGMRPKGSTIVVDYVHPNHQGYLSISDILKDCLLGNSQCNNF